MKILLDTNILVHAHNGSSPQQEKARDIIRKAIGGEIQACLTPQVLYEFYAVITNPKRVENPLAPIEAANVCRDFWESQMIEKICPSPLLTAEVFTHAGELKLSRGKIFDCVLALTAKENRIETVYTENVDDFKIYKFLKCVNPLK